VYASSEPGAAGLFAPDEAWVKARWGPLDPERVVRRAELAAWMAHRALAGSLTPGGAGSGAYEVHIALGFKPADAMPGQIDRESDLRELIVVDIQPVPVQLEFDGSGDAPPGLPSPIGGTGTALSLQ
jgi:hypothetical protein